jgi:hypothetical protein
MPKESIFIDLKMIEDFKESCHISFSNTVDVDSTTFLKTKSFT